MSARQFFLLPAVCLLLAYPSPSVAGSPAATGLPRPRTDALGDPLPEGAIARFGTARLRHPNGVKALAFSPSGKLLASAGWNNEIRLWDPATGKPRGQFQGHGVTVRAIAFAPDGRTLVSASSDGTVRLWDIARRRQLRELIRDAYAPTFVAFAAGGRTVAALGQGSFWNWETATGKELSRIQDRFWVDSGHEVALSADGKALFAPFDYQR
jgi:WD40 repeat protein